MAWLNRYNSQNQRYFNYNQMPYNIPQNNFNQGFNRSNFNYGNFNQGNFNQGNFNQGNFNQGNFNQNNGIISKPIDENVLKELQSNIISNPQNSIKNNTNDNIQEISILIQNERNASIFYKHLSEICNDNKNKIKLHKISESCLVELQKYNEVYKEAYGIEFKTNDSKINTILDLKNGIKLALEEESCNIDKLIEIYEKLSNKEMKEKVFLFISIKISRVISLQLIINDY